jgi:hypothetical protein
LLWTLDSRAARWRLLACPMARWEFAKISLTGLSGAILTYPDGSELTYRDLPERQDAVTRC